MVHLQGGNYCRRDFNIIERVNAEDFLNHIYLAGHIVFIRRYQYMQPFLFVSYNLEFQSFQDFFYEAGFNGLPCNTVYLCVADIQLFISERLCNIIYRAINLATCNFQDKLCNS